MKKKSFTIAQRSVHLGAMINRRKENLSKAIRISDRRVLETEVKLLCELKRENDTKKKIQEEAKKASQLF